MSLPNSNPASATMVKELLSSLLGNPSTPVTDALGPIFLTLHELFGEQARGALREILRLSEEKAQTDLVKSLSEFYAFLPNPCLASRSPVDIPAGETKKAPVAETNSAGKTSGVISTSSGTTKGLVLTSTEGITTTTTSTIAAPVPSELISVREKIQLIRTRDEMSIPYQLDNRISELKECISNNGLGPRRWYRFKWDHLPAKGELVVTQFFKDVGLDYKKENGDFFYGIFPKN